MTLSVLDLLGDFSVEITGKDREELLASREMLPSGTRVNVTFLSNEDLEARLTAARAVRESGLRPVPHISARRLRTEAELRAFLSALQAIDAARDLFIVAGDPPEPEGPYADALALIESGLLADSGTTAVGIGGYPEGHPQIPDALLWEALEAKVAALAERSLETEIITQFGFDAGAVAGWIEQVRARAITVPIRVGVPGPAGVKRLLGYAKRFGAQSSTAIARKYGLSLTNLLSVAGPDQFLTNLASELDSDIHGTVKVHFYTFGGVRATADWAREFLLGARV